MRACVRACVCPPAPVTTACHAARWRRVMLHAACHRLEMGGWGSKPFTADGAIQEATEWMAVQEGSVTTIDAVS